MVSHACTHRNVLGGILQCDISRTTGDPALYSIQLRANICSDCGNVELLCESLESVCAWLTNKQQHDVRPANSRKQKVEKQETRRQGERQHDNVGRGSKHRRAA